MINQIKFFQSRKNKFITMPLHENISDQNSICEFNEISLNDKTLDLLANQLIQNLENFQIAANSDDWLQVSTLDQKIKQNFEQLIQKIQNKTNFFENSENPEKKLQISSQLINKASMIYRTVNQQLLAHQHQLGDNIQKLSISKKAQRAYCQ